VLAGGGRPHAPPPAPLHPGRGRARSGQAALLGGPRSPVLVR
jgi:hypothetical protein